MIPATRRFLPATFRTSVSLSKCHPCHAHVKHLLQPRSRNAASYSTLRDAPTSSQQVPGSKADMHGYTVKEQPLGTLRPVRVIIIGAGVSGINLARTLKQQTVRVEHVIYDKNPDVGGTWYENCYPGCASDDPSHNYQFTHTPNPGWSSLFSPAPEIRKYLVDICNICGLRDHMKLSHSVVHAKWEEGASEWVLQVKNEATGAIFEDRCNFLCDAKGIFNDWKWPDIKGLHSFKGDLIHTAKWPKDFDHRSKRVAVIGNGASGVQIVPVLQPEVKKLVHFIRTKTWISPTSKAVEHVHQYELDSANQFTAKQVQEFRLAPEKYLAFVRKLEALGNQRFKSILKGSPEAEEARQTISRYMDAALHHDPELIAALKPDFPVGSRRITPGVGYLDALLQPNTRVVSTGIEEITADGIKLTSGEFIEVDAIVCATGFNCSFVPRFPMIGEYGNLQDRWRDSPPEAYMSCMVPGMPNYFTYLGPNGPLAHGAIPLISERLTLYLLQFLHKCQTSHITSFRPLPAAVHDYNTHIQAFMPRTVWADTNVRSWYCAGKADGPVLALHPGSPAHFFHMLEKPRWEDFEWRVSGENRFAYLGNGFSTREGEEGGEKDSTWYMGEPEGFL
ncbi:phenylacetone monooxygenase protein [Rutstroemia sp. NJR-2017a WRK4]|nr:phenylacetone monooxygenase protein [Rutstroemia sp. NJR-2017a WRK4]